MKHSILPGDLSALRPWDWFIIALEDATDAQGSYNRIACAVCDVSSARLSTYYVRPMIESRIWES